MFSPLCWCLSWPAPSHILMGPLVGCEQTPLRPGLLPGPHSSAPGAAPVGFPLLAPLPGPQITSPKSFKLWLHLLLSGESGLRRTAAHEIFKD